MPVDSKYTDDIIKTLRREARPMTASEIQEAVGMSRQAAYQWLESNAWRIREVGTGRNGARAYMLAEDDEAAGIVGAAASGMPNNFKPARVWQTKPRSNRQAPPVTSLLKGDAGDLQVGSTLTVTAIRLMGGSIVIEMTTETGGVLSFMLG